MLDNSQPTHFYVPEGSIFTIADETADLMDAVGYDVGPAERLVLHALLPQKRNGKWAGLESGIACPRQNLKTATMIAAALHDTFVQAVPRVVWTAHEFKTSGLAFAEFQQIIESNDWLSREVRRIRTANGSEGFDLRNGSKLRVLARTGRSGRGFASSRLYTDEAMFLEAKMMGALVPTMAAMPNAHMVHGSSPGVPKSAIFRSVRDRGRSGTDPSLGWIEWSQDKGACADPECTHRVGVEGCWLDDFDAVARVNPAYPRRISREFILDERRTLESVPQEYLRERMGVWEDPASASELSLYPLDDWTECLDDTVKHHDGAQLVLAVDVSWDRTLASIAVAEVVGDKLRMVQQIAQIEPQDVREFLTARMDRLRPMAITVQANGAPASTLVQDLEALGVPLHALHGGDMAKAAGHLVDAMRAQTVRHSGQPELDQAVATAISRPLGDGWAIDRKKSPMNVAGLVAVSEALWVLDSLVGSADYDISASVH